MKIIVEALGGIEYILCWTWPDLPFNDQILSLCAKVCLSFSCGTFERLPPHYHLHGFSDDGLCKECDRYFGSWFVLLFEDCIPVTCIIEVKVWFLVLIGFAHVLLDCRIRNGENGIHFLLNRDGKRRGDALIEMESEQDVQKALEKHRMYMGQRYVEGMWRHVLPFLDQYIRLYAFQGSFIWSLTIVK